MSPIFNKQGHHVGWIDGTNVFDPQLRWVAFISGKNIFSASSLKWIGAISNGSIHDTKGYSVAYLFGYRPEGRINLITPSRPVKPLTPIRRNRPIRLLNRMKPPTPLGGWSKLDFSDWYNSQKTPSIPG